MKLERVKNTKRNVFHGAAFRILSTILPFIDRTILLRRLGVEYLGINSLFISILSVLSLAELGFGTAIIYCMYKPVAEDDTETVCALLELYKKIYRWVGTIILGAGICVSPFLKHLISGEVPSDINIYLVFFIQLGNTVISYLFFAYKSSILSAYQREDVISKVSAGTLILQYLVQYLVILTMHNYYAYLLIVPITTLIRNVFKYFLASRIFPLCNQKTEKRLDEEKKYEILKRVRALFLHKIGGVITNSLDSVVVSAFIGLSATAIYNNYWHIMSSVGNTIAILYVSILAGIGNSVASESIDNNYKKFNRLTIFNNWIVGWCSICMLCLYQPFMKLWVGVEYMFPFHTMVLFVIYFYINLIRRINVTFKDACGIWIEDRYKPLVSGFANVILNIVLIQIIGIDGVLISSIVSLAVVEFPWEVYVLFKSYFARGTRRYYIRMAVSAVFIVLTSIVTYLVAHFAVTKYIYNDVSALVITAIICIVVPNIIFLLVWHDKIRFVKSYLKR